MSEDPVKLKVIGGKQAASVYMAFSFKGQLSSFQIYLDNIRFIHPFNKQLHGITKKKRKRKKPKIKSLLFRSLQSSRGDKSMHKQP